MKSAITLHRLHRYKGTSLVNSHHDTGTGVWGSGEISLFSSFWNEGKEAGLPDECRTHGLRKAGATIAANAGASTTETPKKVRDLKKKRNKINEL
ncbi:hypothetical protein B488_02310 [Liberibacter crescens BT-1]|uniref:Uncharacterized protein n=2 Tax=Liberibacter crescens TaxID=1273132 RepID=L0ERV0_LIBCB|nr:hypothetical protein B488_02310 [Liberibacter crescens BT-1]